jgi:hypothetical protein
MSFRGPAGLTEANADESGPSALVFTLAGRASYTGRTGMAEESGMVCL